MWHSLVEVIAGTVTHQQRIAYKKMIKMINEKHKPTEKTARDDELGTDTSKDEIREP